MGWARLGSGAGAGFGRGQRQRLWAVDVDTEAPAKEGDGATPPPPPPPPAFKPPMTEAERLQLQSQMLKLQAEKLRLEAEREQIQVGGLVRLVALWGSIDRSVVWVADRPIYLCTALQMEREALLKKQKRQQEMDRLIEKLRATKGEAGELKHVVQTYLRGVDADVVMRLRELSAEAEAPEQALAYKQLGDAVLAAVLELDGKQAKEIREEIAFRLKDTVKVDVGNREAMGMGGEGFDQMGGVEELMRNQSLRTSSIDQLTQEMMRNNSRGFSTIYAINLPQWLPREVGGWVGGFVN